jgi:sodium transport system permease protein
MKLGKIGIVYRKELVDSLRDRRTLFSMVVAPILLMPVLILGMGGLVARSITKLSKELAPIMVLGAEHSAATVEGLKKIKTLKLVPPSTNYAEMISNRKIRAAIEISTGFDEALRTGESATIRIHKYEGDVKSQFGVQQLEHFFRNLHDETVAARLRNRELPAGLVRPFEVVQNNVAPPAKVGGSMLGGIIPYMIIMMCFAGAMYPAIDLTAGEKERGTIETILCSPVSRLELALGKFLMVFTGSMASAVFSMASLTATFYLAKYYLGFQGRSGMLFATLTIDPNSILAVFLIMVPVVVFFAATLLAIALLARSYKEAQSYISPLMMVIIMPAVMSLMPGVELNSKLAWVPVLNTSLVSKEVISGHYPWALIGVTFASSCIYAAIALGIATRLFEREEVIFRT